YSMFSGGPTLMPRSRVILIPFWLLATLTCVLPALWVRGLWRHWQRTRNQNLCPVCSYDLRASPERCPECGTEHRSFPYAAAARARSAAIGNFAITQSHIIRAGFQP